MPVIIPISSDHCHHEMTIEQQHTMLGILIVVHLIWLITITISSIKFINDNYEFKNSYFYYVFNDFEFWNILMTFLASIELIILFGYLIGKFF